jgi:hypothetical protein
MVNFPGRNGRRRRVLNEEVLSASCSHTALRVMTSEDATGAVPRYSEAAGVEHHPQITDFVPRRYRSVAVLIALAISTTAGLAGMDYFATLQSGMSNIANVSAFQLGTHGSIAAWISSVVLVIASATCVLVYSIRRHRIDDFRGRYRIWLAAAVACFMASLNSATGLHNVLADVMNYVTGWTALRDGAIWWLVAAGLPLAWIFARVFLDVKDCRLAAALLVLATSCYAAAVVIHLELLFVDAALPLMIVGASTMLGHWFAFASTLSYARFVILDAQGLVVNRPRITGRRKTKTSSPAPSPAQRKQTATATTSSNAASSSKPSALQPPKSPAARSQWVDGSRPEREDYDDDDSSGDGRKLTKAERKQLRKLKMQNRAA